MYLVVVSIQAVRLPSLQRPEMDHQKFFGKFRSGSHSLLEAELEFDTGCARMRNYL
jgi:hypothetical protein